MEPALGIKGFGIFLGLIVVTLKDREPFDTDLPPMLQSETYWIQIESAGTSLLCHDPYEVL